MTIHICPNCKKIYQPILVSEGSRPIQEQFLNVPKWQREQIISGICSDGCWDMFLGVKKEVQGE